MLLGAESFNCFNTFPKPSGQRSEFAQARKLAIALGNCRNSCQAWEVHFLSEGSGDLRGVATKGLPITVGSAFLKVEYVVLSCRHPNS